jgi:hypothetical protein
MDYEFLRAALLQFLPHSAAGLRTMSEQERNILRGTLQSVLEQMEDLEEADDASVALTA